MNRLSSSIRALFALAALAAGIGVAPAGAQDGPAPRLQPPGWEPAIRVGNLVDYSGRTAVLGRKYGQGKADAIRFINDHGGINGLTIDLLTVDYAYVLPQAVNAYNIWMTQGNLAAIQGWGVADVRGLKELVTRDQIPYFSASFDADRLVLSPNGGAPVDTPYHFFVGPDAVDGVHALLQWAAADWAASGRTETPLYVHLGDGSDFATIGKAPGEARAGELGFQVYSALRYGGEQDNGSVCRALMAESIDYAYLANTGDANARLIKTCRDMGVTTRFMTNIWGFDEQMLQSLGTAGDGVVWVMATATWGEDVPGMALLEEIAAHAGSAGEPKSVHYIQGVCAVYFMKDAMERAGYMRGGITGPNIRTAMYERRAWTPLGLEGVCNPGTWAANEHRGVSDIWVYRARVTQEGYRMERAYTASVSPPGARGEQAPPSGDSGD